MKRICQKELARKLGVSQAAISGVLNGNASARIGEATRARILEALKEANYQPNRLANALFGRKTKTVGIIYQGGYVQLGVRKLTEVVKGLSDRGFLPLVYDLMLEAKGEEQCQLLADLKVRGVILINVTDTFMRDIYPKYLQGKMNVAAIDSPEMEGVYPLYSDKVQGFQLLARHLVEQGFKKIGVILSGGSTKQRTSPTSPLGGKAVLRGIEQELAAGGLKTHAVEFFDSTNSVPSYASDPYWAGMYSLGKMLDDGARPDAVICSSDPWAIGAIHECSRRGIRVPEDIAIVGFNDDVQSRYATPPLTTISPPVERLADLAIRHITEASDEPIGRVETGAQFLPCELVIRASSSNASPCIAS